MIWISNIQCTTINIVGIYASHVYEVFHQCLLERIMGEITPTQSQSQLWVLTPVQLIIIIIILWLSIPSDFITNILWLSNPLGGTSITTTILRLSNPMVGTSTVIIWSRHSLSTSLSHHNHTFTDPNQHPRIFTLTISNNECSLTISNHNLLIITLIISHTNRLDPISNLHMSVIHQHWMIPLLTLWMKYLKGLPLSDLYFSILVFFNFLNFSIFNFQPTTL